jgi:mannosylglycerate hydrolase
MDNNPAWDEAFARVPPEPRTTIQRTDTRHVDPSMRPSEDFYKRVIALVDLYADLDWDPAQLWRYTPFKIADVALNAILHRAERDLLALAQRFGSAAERMEIADRLNLSAAAIGRLWSEGGGIYQPLDLIAGQPITAATSAGFLAGLGRGDRCRSSGSNDPDPRSLDKHRLPHGAQHITRAHPLRAAALLAWPSLGGGQFHDRPRLH